MKPSISINLQYNIRLSCAIADDFIVFGDLEYNVSIYTMCQKKLCQLMFCSLSAKYEPISTKIGKSVPE